MVEIEKGEAIIEDKIYSMKIDRPFLFMLRNNKLPKDHDMVFMAKIEKIE